jgi:DNA-binding XRE family transcriptional regulator
MSITSWSVPETTATTDELGSWVSQYSANATTEFGVFLRMLRRRVPPQRTTLGCLPRLPIRCGRPVSQDEIAEAVGITRAWYAKLENDTRVHASMKLLDKLANALELSTKERITLFILAIPEIKNTVSGVA